MVNPGNMIQQAIKKGQHSIDKSIDTLTVQNGEIISRLNWLMVANQEICNKLDITLVDPLKGYKKSKGGKR